MAQLSTPNPPKLPIISMVTTKTIENMFDVVVKKKI